MSTHPMDPYGIIPLGVQVAAVRPFDFQVRTIVDYDVAFMQDRVRSDVFVNGKPVGIYAVAKVDDGFTRDGRHGLQRALETYGPDLERMVADEFMGLGYRRRVQELEYQVNRLQAMIDRPRWWQFRPVRRRWRTLRATMAARIAPEEQK